MTILSSRKKENPDRLGTRLSTELKDKVEYAAQLKGVPTAGFVKTVLAEAADKTIREHDFIQLSRHDREAFAQSLMNPPQPSEKAIAAAKGYKKRLGL